MLALDERKQLLQLRIRRHVDADPPRSLALDAIQLVPEHFDFRLRNFDLDTQGPHLVVDGYDLVDARRRQHFRPPKAKLLSLAPRGLKVAARGRDNLTKLLRRGHLISFRG